MKKVRSTVKKHGILKRIIPIIILLAGLLVTLVLVKQSQDMRQHADTPAVPQPDGQSGTWNLILDEEFNGTSLDTSKWSYGVDSDGLGGQSHYDPSACSFSNGELHLTGSVGSTVGKPYTGCGIWTQGKVPIPAYGYTEMRARIPAVKGTWPALWSVAYDRLTDSSLYVWEIDTMEAIDHNIADGTEVSWNLHARNASGGDDDFAAYHDPNSLGTSLYNQWHTYATSWTPTKMTWLVDGIPQFSVTEGQVINGKTVHIPNMRQVEIVQMPVGGAEAVDSARLPATMDVDYVRIWQPGSGSLPTNIPLPTEPINPSPTIKVGQSNSPTPFPSSTPRSLVSCLSSTGNVLQNCSFEAVNSSWLTPWTLDISNGHAHVYRDNTTSVDGTYSAKVLITSASRNPWDIQLSQGNVSFISGHTYHINFWAKASSQRTVQVVLQQNYSPYNEYSDKNISISTVWQQYSDTYTPSVSDTNTLFTFNLARNRGSIWFDNISIR